MTDHPSVKIEGATYAILCGICKAPISRLAEGEDGTDMMGCTTCGNAAHRDEVVAIIGDFVKNTTAININKSLAKMARGSKLMKFSGKTVDNKTYRFVVDLKA